jgi:hypothetical protein
VERVKLIMQIIERFILTLPTFRVRGGNFHHVCEIDHCLDAGRAFGLRRIFACPGIEQIATAAEPNQENREDEKSNGPLHGNLLLTTMHGSIP